MRTDDRVARVRWLRRTVLLPITLAVLAVAVVLVCAGLDASVSGLLRPGTAISGPELPATWNPPPEPHGTSVSAELRDSAGVPAPAFDWTEQQYVRQAAAALIAKGDFENAIELLSRFDATRVNSVALGAALLERVSAAADGSI